MIFSLFHKKVEKRASTWHLIFNLLVVCAQIKGKRRPNNELFDECRIYLEARDGKKKILIDLAAKKR